MIERQRQAARISEEQAQFIQFQIDEGDPPSCWLQITNPRSAGWLLDLDKVPCPADPSKIVEYLLGAALSCRGRYRECIARMETLPRNDEFYPAVCFLTGNTAVRDYWEMLQCLDAVPDRWSPLPAAIDAFESGLAAPSSGRDSHSRAVAWNNAGWALVQSARSSRPLEKARDYLNQAFAYFQSRGSADEASVAKANLAKAEQRLDRMLGEIKPLLADVEKARANSVDILEIPQGVVTFPQLRISHHLWRAITISGDFYNFLFRNDGTLGVLLVDVEGHGIPAMQEAQAIRQAMFRPSGSWGNGDPVENLELADLRIQEELGLHGFAAPMSYTVIDPITSTVHHANAGMPAPLIFRRGGAHPVPLVAKGAYVGAGYSSIIASPRLATEEFHAGDLLVLFSDGIPEARDRNGALLGIAGIVRTIERVGEAAPETIAFEIERAVREHIPDAAPDDDQTLIVIRRE